MGFQRYPHGIWGGLPAPCRPFDIGGQERGNAHWCTIGVSVIFSKGLLVHHPVCR